MHTHPSWAGILIKQQNVPQGTDRQIYADLQVKQQLKPTPTLSWLDYQVQTRRNNKAPLCNNDRH